jgi:hypothetical protein
MEHVIANFPEPNLVSVFAGPCGIRKTRQITGEDLQDLANSPRQGHKRTSNLLYENCQQGIPEKFH